MRSRKDLTVEVNVFNSETGEYIANTYYYLDKVDLDKYDYIEDTDAALKQLIKDLTNG